MTYDIPGGYMPSSWYWDKTGKFYRSYMSIPVKGKANTFIRKEVEESEYISHTGVNPELLRKSKIKLGPIDESRSLN